MIALENGEKAGIRPLFGQNRRQGGLIPADHCKFIPSKKPAVEPRQHLDSANLSFSFYEHCHSLPQTIIRVTVKPMSVICSQFSGRES